MEQIIGLYRILIGVSAVALIFGLGLIFSRLAQLRTEQKLLSVLALANMASMSMLLFGAKHLYGTDFRELVLLLDVLILILNLVVGYFVFAAVSNPSIGLARHAQQLFLVSFVAVCVFFAAYYIFNGSGSVLSRDNPAFYWLYGLALLLFAAGSLLPAIRSGIRLTRKPGVATRVLVIVALNGATNLVGLVLFVNKLPTKDIGVVLNIVFNLAFSYYLAYYFLSEYFVVQPKESEAAHTVEEVGYSWEALSSRLRYWGETKTYLSQHVPEIVAEVEQYPLSDLEKIHYSLKQLNIRAKDIADAMNVSVRAVEMQRYRIKKKLEGDQQQCEANTLG